MLVILIHFAETFGKYRRVFLSKTILPHPAGYPTSDVKVSDRGLSSPVMNALSKL